MTSSAPRSARPPAARAFRRRYLDSNAFKRAPLTVLDETDAADAEVRRRGAARSEGSRQGVVGEVAVDDFAVWATGRRQRRFGAPVASARVRAERRRREDEGRKADDVVRAAADRVEHRKDQRSSDRRI